MAAGRAQTRYSQLETDRSAYLQRARDASKLTIPSLVPESDDVSTQRLPTPWQSIGARGTNNLSSKLLLALFPPNTPFFRFIPDQAIVDSLKGVDEEAKTEIERVLGNLERSIMDRIESMGARVQLFEALKHLIVAGNVLLFVGRDGIKVYHLDKYVVKRDPNGEVREIVIKERISPSALPDRFLQLVNGNSTEDKKSLELYTYVELRNGKYHVHQEVQGQTVPGSEGSYPKDKTPFLALRFTKIDGEDYGRGFIEEYYGDLNSLERLSKAIVEGSAAAAKVLFLVNPNGTTRAKTLQEAPNGAIRQGSMNDISVLQLDKFADFRVTLDTLRDVQERLSFAFLLNSAVQRNGERVTAEEIRYMAGELEDALGGVYSILSLELQLPFVARVMHMMEKEGKMPDLPKDLVRPAIVTGLEALGRGHDLQKLDLFLAGLQQTLGPEVLQQFVNLGDYIARRATALGIDTTGLIKSDEQRAQEQEAAQQQALLQQFGPQAMDLAGKAIQEGVKQNGSQ